MNDSVDVLRFSRQMLVPGIGRDGQLYLSRSKVLIVGCGGIGSSVILYLAAAGVPLTLVDHDLVEVSNLHRQIVHNASALGENKAESAARCAREQHGGKIAISAVPEKLSASNARTLVSAADLIVDATDNAEARYLINDACFFEKKALLSGSAVGMEGQLMLFDFRSPVSVGAAELLPEHERPCYRCLYPVPAAVQSCRSCADAGVLGPVPGLVGCLQAVEAIKWLLLRDSASVAAQQAVQAGLRSMQGQLLYDAFTGQFHAFSLPSRKLNCGLCGSEPCIRAMSDSAASLEPAPAPNPACTLATDNLESQQPFKFTAGPQIAVHVPEVTAVAYNELKRLGRPHLLLDVRSTVQFELINLAHLFPCKSEEVICQKLLHIPLAHLQGRGSLVGGAAAQEERSRGAVQSVQTARQALGLNSPVYVLCRRGVDSVIATQLLQSIGLHSVFNVRGGLRSWSQDVDPEFPVY